MITTVICSRCKLRLEVKTVHTGTVVTCPACGTRLGVPKGGIQPPHTVTDVERQIQAAQERHRRHVAVALGVVILGAFLVLLLAIAIGLMGGFGVRGSGSGVGRADTPGKGGGAASSGAGTGGQSAAAAQAAGAGGAGAVSSSATNAVPVPLPTARAPSVMSGTNQSETAQPATNAPAARPAASVTSSNVSAEITRPVVFTNPPPASVATNVAVETPEPPAGHGVLALGDEFSRRLAEAGAKSGDVQISLMWNNMNDLDLHCVDTKGEEIYYGHKQAASGGELDVDRNANPPFTSRPVENIYWPRGSAPAGLYRVYVNHYANRGGVDPTTYTVRVIVSGRTRTFNGSIRSGEPKRFIYEFQLGATR
jgi:ribosomal protein S27E